MTNGTPLDGSKAPLKFLFVSLESLSGDLAWAIKKEEKSDGDVYVGFVEKVEKWEDFADWADVICFDDVEFGEAAEKLRKKGKLVIGGASYTDRRAIERGVRGTPPK